MKRLVFFVLLSIIPLQYVFAQEVNKNTVDYPTDGKTQMGVNFNEKMEGINFQDLKRIHTTWTRGFIEFFRLYPDVPKLESDSRVQGFCELKKHGYKTILNIKWNFHHRDFPAPGSPTMLSYENYLRKLLDVVWNGTDLLVVGNEPFIEAKDSEKGAPLVAFYKHIAAFIHNYELEKRNGRFIRKSIPIFMGSFDNQYLKSWRTKWVRELLAYSKKQPWIAGIDIHIHHNKFDQIRESIDHVNDKIRDNQKILITEFSHVKYFQTKMNDNIPGQFAGKYNLNPVTKNYQFINQAIHHPVSKGEWDDFLRDSNWFEVQKHYLRDAYRVFESYPKVAVAAYCMRQQYAARRNFTGHEKPWILNGIMAVKTVRPNPVTGEDQFNYFWINDFLAIQKDKFNRVQNAK